MNFDRLWERFTRVTMFFVGVGILIFETGWEHGDRFYLITAAVGMMGPEMARRFERLILAIREKPLPEDDP